MTSTSESHVGTIDRVSIQIAVRLPDFLVEWIDQEVAAGAGSRAKVVSNALHRYRRQVLAERDAEIYRTTGGYPDLVVLSADKRDFPPLD